jgi:hypothetical protein
MPTSARSNNGCAGVIWFTSVMAVLGLGLVAIFALASLREVWSEDGQRRIVIVPPPIMVTRSKLRTHITFAQTVELFIY